MSKKKKKNYQRQYKENMTDEEKQKYKEAKIKRNRDRYNKMTDEKKFIKTYQDSKNKKEEIIKNNIQKI